MHDNIDTNAGQDDPEVTALLKDYPVPSPDANFFDQSLAHAVIAGQRRQRRGWLAAGFVSAVAAGVVFWIVGGLWFASPTASLPTSDIPNIAMTVEEPRTIHLLFASDVALQDAMLTVSLPRNVELSGFPGQREVSWQTSLAPGKNRLPLKLIATSPLQGEVLATLLHDNRSRTFRLHVDVS